MLSNYCCSTEILLQTLLVTIEVFGKQSIVRSLIETGSQRSYVLISTVGKLCLKLLRYEILIHTVFGESISRRKHKCYALQFSKLSCNDSYNIEILDQPVICGTVPRMKEIIYLDELQANGIQLHDVEVTSSEVEFLVADDYAVKSFSGLVF